MTQTPSQTLAPALTAQDLKGFDRRRVALIREMESHGWRGRRGAKAHVIMRAPDGSTTTAISRKVISPKDQHNVARDFRAWLRRQEKAAAEPLPVIHGEITFAHPHEPLTVDVARPVRPAPEPDPAPVDTAPEPVAVERNTRLACDQEGCEKDFATLQALSVHKVRSHVKVECPVCDRPMAPGNLPRHMRAHVERIGTHEQAMREVVQLRALVARLTDEVAEWQALAEGSEAELAELTCGMRALIGD